MREGSLSERELNSHVGDLRRCSPVQVCKRITAGQGHGFVSEDRLHQKAHGVWRRSSPSRTVLHDDGGSCYQVDGGRGRGRVLLPSRRWRRMSMLTIWCGWTARLVPLTVDGLIYASSMVMLDSARRAVPVSALARWLLGLASRRRWRRTFLRVMCTPSGT